MSLPRISIIIPSYNQGKFIEETLLSVLDQKYPDLELIVIDGGSTDKTLEILERYKTQISYIISEPDRGQTHGINKGLKKITGELWSYLNSDDLLLSGSLMTIAVSYQKNPQPWIAGISEKFDERGSQGYIHPTDPRTKADYLAPWNRNGKYFLPCSNVCFMSKAVIDKIGLFDENLHYSMDIEYYVKAIFEGKYEPYYIHEVLGKWRIHDESKTMTRGSAYGFRQDEVTIAERYEKYLHGEERKKLADEIRNQQKWVYLRKLTYESSQKKQRIPLFKLIQGIFEYPEFLWFRPWYGTIRMSLFPKS